VSVWYMPPFDLVMPRDLDAALHHLASWASETRIIAGGTDLLPSMRMRLFEPKYVLSIRHLPELRHIETDDDWLRIGSGVTLNVLCQHPVIARDFPAICKTAGTVAAPNIRNMGTIGGNILLDTRCHWYNQSYFWRKGIGFCLKKDGTVCHVAPGGRQCWAAYSGDTAAALMPLDAHLRLVSPRGERTVPMRNFFVNDGQKRHILQPDELLAEILVPRAMAGYRAQYFKFRIRKSVDYPLVGVCVLVRRHNGRCMDARIGLTAVAPCPRAWTVPREWLEDAPEEWIPRAVDTVARLAKPLRTSLLVRPDYRRHLVRVYTRRGLEALTNTG